MANLQIIIALAVALHVGGMALKLGTELYK
ncbi:MAG: photosystem I reaction center subunit XII [Prochlorothrix sp.]|nr:photosystem I reaction center subunit XII [Prochlorothrix hollandica]MEB3163402.1 photosystem I reaction center subunit XII [Prochlorothrix sp.]